MVLAIVVWTTVAPVLSTVTENGAVVAFAALSVAVIENATGPSAIAASAVLLELL